MIGTTLTIEPPDITDRMLVAGCSGPITMGPAKESGMLVMSPKYENANDCVSSIDSGKSKMPSSA